MTRRPAGGARPDETRDRLEEPQEVEALVARPAGRVDLGQDLRQRGAVTWGQRAHQRRVAGGAAAQHVDPGRNGSICSVS